jgi:hypothetical protein
MPLVNVNCCEQRSDRRAAQTARDDHCQPRGLSGPTLSSCGNSKSAPHAHRFRSNTWNASSPG